MTGSDTASPGPTEVGRHDHHGPADHLRQGYGGPPKRTASRRRGGGSRTLPRRRFFFGARGAEDESEAVVPFSAGVLVDRPFELPHQDLARPRTDPRRRIVDREPIADRVGVRARKAFDDVQASAREDVLTVARRRAAER